MNKKFGEVIAYIAIGMLALIAFLIGCTVIAFLFAVIRSFI